MTESLAESSNTAHYTKAYAEGYTKAVTQYVKNKDNPDFMERVLHAFAVNPPENDHQEGYKTAVESIRRFGVPVHHQENIVYVGWIK
tara:strand:+ start:10999 stop:11259 length:261 start_codon:yes stop_codon:yes gene_type:complete